MDKKEKKLKSARIKRDVSGSYNSLISHRGWKQLEKELIEDAMNAMQRLCDITLSESDYQNARAEINLTQKILNRVGSKASVWAKAQAQFERLTKRQS